MKQAYIDSCVWITAVEGFPEYQAKIDPTLGLVRYIFM